MPLDAGSTPAFSTFMKIGYQQLIVLGLMLLGGVILATLLTGCATRPDLPKDYETSYVKDGVTYHCKVWYNLTIEDHLVYNQKCWAIQKP